MAGPLGTRGLTIADLRHQVTIQRRKAGGAATRDEFGAEVEEWTDQAVAVWCEVLADGGREFLRSGTVQANVTHSVIMRDRADLTPKDRLIWLDRENAVLNVTAVVTNVGRMNTTKLACLLET